MAYTHPQASAGATRTAQNTTALTVQYGSNVTVGSLLVAIVGTYGSGGATVTVSDDQNGSWTQAGSYQTYSSLGRISVWYKQSSVGAVKPTVSVTPSTSCLITYSIDEYAGGIQSGTAVDTAVVATGTGTAIDTGSCAVSNAHSLMICGAAQVITSGDTWTAGTDFTLGYNQTNGLTNVALGTEYLLDVSAAHNGTITQSGNLTWGAICVSFKPQPPTQTATPGVAAVTVAGVDMSVSASGTATATPGVAAVTVAGIALGAAIVVTLGVANVTISVAGILTSVGGWCRSIAQRYRHKRRRPRGK